MSYQVLNWPELFPLGTDPFTVLEDERKRKVIQNAIAIYLAGPSPNKKNMFGKTPGIIQNFYKTEKGKAIQNFDNARREGYQMQNYSTSSSFVEFWDNLKLKFSYMPRYDESYKMLFRDIPLEGKMTWQVRDVTNYITYARIPEGGKIKYHGGYDEQTTARTYFYGAGHGIQEQALMSREYVQIEEGLTALRDGAYRSMAEFFYALIEAVGAPQNTSWQATTLLATDFHYQSDRDMNTFNKAAEQIITDCKDKGYGPIESDTFGILHQYTYAERVKRALGRTLEQYAGSQKLSTYNFMPITTTMLTDPTKIYVVLPKRKLQMATFMQLRQFNRMNQDNLLREFANWLAWGGLIGDQQQVRRCATV